MSSELVKHAECTKASPHKGRRPSAASTKGGERLRRPPPFVDFFVGVVFCVLCVVGLHICVLGASLDTIALPAE